MIVLLAGEIASGKTTLAANLTELGGTTHLSVRQLLRDVLADATASRAFLQSEGTKLEERTSGRWIAETVLQEHRDATSHLVVDSIRTIAQAEAFLDLFDDVCLVYLEASRSVRQERYGAHGSSDELKSAISFKRATSHPTETDAASARRLANLVVDTDLLSPQDVARVVATHLKLF